MLDLNRTMFYKVRFDITSLEGEDLLWALIRHIRKWLNRKARSGGHDLDMNDPVCSEFKRGSLIESDDGWVRLRSFRHFEGDESTWACQIIENVDFRDGTAPRQWVTEIGFFGKTREEGTMSLVLSFGDRPGFLGPLQRVPDSSIPRLVTNILDDETLRCHIADIDIIRHPIAIDEHNAEDIFKQIISPMREVPIVFVPLREKAAEAVDPVRLVELLGPNALVYYTNGPTQLQIINNLLRTHNLETYAGSVRVFAARPNVEDPADSGRHRFFKYQEIIENGADYIYDIFRRGLAEDVHFWEELLRIDDVRRLNNESSTQRRFETKLGTVREQLTQDALEIIDDVGQENADLIAENERLREDNEALRKDVWQSESKAQALRDALDNRAGKEHDDEAAALVQTFKNMPPSPLDIGRLIVSIFPDRIDFTERGWRSLGETTFSPMALWCAFLDICQVLYPLFASNECSDIARRFHEQSLYEYAPGEGSATHGDSDLMKLREDTYDNRRISIEPHVKRGSKPTDDHFVRIYLCWDKTTSKIVVGYCRDHLDNYSTKGMK